MQISERLIGWKQRNDMQGKIIISESDIKEMCCLAEDVMNALYMNYEPRTLEEIVMESERLCNEQKL